MKKSTKIIIGISILLVILLIAISTSMMSTKLEESVTSNNAEIYSIKTMSSNSHLIKQGENLILVDAGDASKVEDLEKNIVGLGFDPATIDLLIITHGHADHAGGTKYFKEKYGIKVLAGSGDKHMLAIGKNEPLCPTNSIARMMAYSAEGAEFPAIEADYWVDNEVFDLSELGMNGEIIPMEGHTGGSIVLKVDNKLFVGDVIRGGMINQHQPNTHFFLCDLDKNTSNIKELLGYECDQWFTGHLGSLKKDDVEKFISKRK